VAIGVILKPERGSGHFKPRLKAAVLTVGFLTRSLSPASSAYFGRMLATAISFLECDIKTGLDSAKKSVSCSRGALGL
jgi:hypothetical protein